MSDSSSNDDARYEDYVRHFARHEAALRRFIGSFLPSWGDVDEVVQRTAIAIWRKFDQFDPGTEFIKWACVVARFEALAYRRKMARDRLVFREDVLELMAEEAAEESTGRGAQHQALESCLLSLPVLAAVNSMTSRSRATRLRHPHLLRPAATSSRTAALRT
ncbi:MAG: sigma factor [Limisphaerales bacterium]